ncbi:hypothetical protein [Staphylococcus shinii]|uniref:hypothetical protein n=1 Tax=Staphylococcus shinii TaxID=2912228 RepID=UPI003F565E4F
MKFKKADSKNKSVDPVNKKWSKLRKKVKKRRNRIRVKYNDKRRPKVLRSIFSDKDPRTKQSGRHTLTYLILLGGAIFCLLMTINGFKNMYHDTIRNTSKIGKELNFPLSETNLKLGAVYTDKAHDLTVVRLNYDNGSRNILPSNGADYDVLLKSKQKKNVKATYGILNPRGDGYIFIKGDMGDQPFVVGLRNKQTILANGAKANDDSSSDSSDLDSGKIENKDELVDSITTPKQKKDSENKLVKWFTSDDEEQPDNDAFKFRINSHSKTTKVYDGSFLDNNGNIKYDEVIKQMNRNETLKQYDKEIAEIEGKDGKIEQQNAVIEENKKKLKKDKNNADAKGSLEKAKTSKSNLEKQLNDYKQNRENIANFNVSKDDFEIMSEPEKTIYKPM